ncbi:MAG: DUF3854 domain-containing protein [Candidatus Acidiferrales bacterium]
MTTESLRPTSPPLASGHLAIFTQLRIAPELLAAAGVHSVSDAEAREYGFRVSSASDLSGIVFPYFDPETNQRVTARLRRDRPDIDETGKARAKYLSPFGDRRHLYFPPGADGMLSDRDARVVFVEAEKSALALAAFAARTKRKLLNVGTGGCWGWRGRTGIGTGPQGDRQEERGPLPDLDRIDFSSEREAVICFDSNFSTNPNVRAARHALAQELAVRGALVKIAELPHVPEVNGPDDLIATSGDEAMLALLDSAQPIVEVAEVEAEAAVAALEADKKRDPTEALDAVAAVGDPVRQSLLVGRICALRIPGLTRPVVEQAIKTNRGKTDGRHVRAREMARQGRLLRVAINPAQLIADLEAYYSRRRYLPTDAAFVEALFAMNTHTYDVFDTTPYLLYDSATSGCGKTTTLERHEQVCARAYFGVDPSAAALYRRIERDQPTWLLDEARILQNHGERGQELLALFDAGYKRGAVVSRCEEHGEGIRDFNVYCPKVLARIGSFRGTLLDRGIPFHLEKAHGLRQRRRNVLMKEAAPLKEKLEAYALQYRAQLQRLYLDEPDDGYWPQISGREEEVWGPLLTHARLAGPDIERRAVKAALEYSGQKAKIAITEDRIFALAQEALEILRYRQGEVFCPRELVQSLAEKEIWGEHLAERKSDKARVTAVGTFFSQFRPASRRHTTAGTEYGRLEVMAVLERHMPETTAPPEEGVRVSAATKTDSESTDYVADTFETVVSASQPTESKKATTGADTMTPQTQGTAWIDEEL